jgi:hypothetical protein
MRLIEFEKYLVFYDYCSPVCIFAAWKQKVYL